MDRRFRVALIVLLAAFTACDKDAAPRTKEEATALLVSHVPEGSTLEQARRFLSSLDLPFSVVTDNQCKEFSEARGVCAGGPAIVVMLNDDAGPWYNPVRTSIHALIAFDASQKLVAWRIWSVGTFI